jgi:hypothetical protein
LLKVKINFICSDGGPRVSPGFSAGAPAAVLLLCLAGLVLRLLAVPELVGDVDGVNLARGLRTYDLFTQSPHAPGYPVLIAAAGCLRAVGVASDAWALALPGILLWPLAGGLLFVGLRRWLGAWPALGVLAVASLAPGAVVASGWPGSEGLGLTLLAAGAGMLGLGTRQGSAGDRWTAAGALTLGLLLGVRLSWAPMAVALVVTALWQRRARIASAGAAAATGVALWLIPMLVLFDPRRLLQLMVSFGEGHLFAWGGTAIAQSGEVGVSRPLSLVHNVWDAGLGAGSSAVGWIIAGLALLAAVRVLAGRDSRRLLFAASLLVLPYLIWLIAFQNVAKMRHVLPLLPFAGMVVGLALASWRYRVAAGLVGVAAMAAATLPRAWTQAHRPVPAVALLDWLIQGEKPEALLVFAGEEARVLEHHAPMYRVVRPADGLVLEREAERVSRLGVRVLVTSSAPGFEYVRGQTTTLKSFRFPRSVRPHDAELSVTRYAPKSERIAWRREP